MKNKKAFTLIELLVVIAIIGILATISIISLSNARAKSRDAKRVADVKQIQTALELFFNDNNRYPTDIEWATGSIGTGTLTYMYEIPDAPTPADGNCSNEENAFVYSASADGGSYTISYCLGSNVGSLAFGGKCASPAGISEGACAGGSNPVALRDSQRLSDIQTIIDAMLDMYSANGYYFKPGEDAYKYDGWSWLGGAKRLGNCSTVTSHPETDPDSLGRYDSDVPCPSLSDWCIKLSADIEEETESSGTSCDSGTVYLRNIPLNNHSSIGSWPGGWYVYNIYAYNDFNTAGDDYFRIRYRLEGDAPQELHSDHFLNGVAANCVWDEFVEGQILCD